MANIKELIKNIRDAIFGKDVRESIAKAIEQCYEDASMQDNANMEVKDARGFFNTLKKRLDNSDNVKADKTEIEDEKAIRENADSKLQNQINSLASGSPLVASSMEEMTDTGRVYVNTTDGHWYTHNGTSWVDGGVYQATEIQDNSVTTQKTNFINISKSINFHNPSTVKYGSFYDGNVGEKVTISNNSRYSANIFEVKNNKTYTLSCMNHKLFVLDDNFSVLEIKSNINTSPEAFTFTINNKKAKYVAYSYINNLHYNFMAVEGENLPEKYEDYYADNVLDNVTINNENIMNEAISPEKTNFIKQIISKNKFNTDDVKKGYIYSTISNWNPGCEIELRPNDKFSTIIIPVENLKTYTMSGSSYWYYVLDENLKALYQGGDPSANIENLSLKIEVSGAKYLVINYKHDVFPTKNFMFIEGDILPDSYIPYEKKYLMQGVEIENIKTNNLYVGSDKEFKTIKQALESITDSSRQNIYNVIIDKGIYDVYQEFGGADYLNEMTNNNEYWGGLVLPNYVNLKSATNSQNDVILKFIIPDSEATTENSNGRNKISPLNLYGNNNVENITIETSNTRYAVHDEDGNTNITDHIQKFNNCKFIHYGGSYGNAFSAGFNSGCEFYFNNCIFISRLNNSFTMHDRGAKKASKIYLENCSFYGKQRSIRFGSAGNKNVPTHEVVINNCNLNSSIDLAEETENSGVGCHFHLRGSGNSKVPHIIIDTSDNTKEFIDFQDETLIVPLGYENAKIGDYVRLNLSNRLYYRSNYQNKVPAGIIVNIMNYNLCRLKTSGYIDKSLIGLGDIPDGTYISYIDNNLTQVSDDTNAIGIIKRDYLYIF